LDHKIIASDAVPIIYENDFSKIQSVLNLMETDVTVVNMYEQKKDIFIKKIFDMDRRELCDMVDDGAIEQYVATRLNKLKNELSN
jgi:hypothetical protein